MLGAGTASALGDLHADRHRRLHDGDGHDDDRGGAGDADDHLAAPAGIVYGTALSAAQLDATASVPGTFTYSPAAGTVPGAGTDTLSVTFTPTDAVDYKAATATTTLAVAQATPTITWASPAGIVYGTALSSAQLDATASVPGTFTYSPAAGTVLGAGAGQALSVTFTPTDRPITPPPRPR